jgi:hypothetical protein
MLADVAGMNCSQVTAELLQPSFFSSFFYGCHLQHVDVPPPRLRRPCHGHQTMGGLPLTNPMIGALLSCPHEEEATRVAASSRKQGARVPGAACRAGDPRHAAPLPAAAAARHPAGFGGRGAGGIRARRAGRFPVCAVR